MTTKTKRIAAALVAVILVAVSCITVFAEETTAVPSPTGNRKITVKIIPSDGGGGHYVMEEIGAGPNNGTLVDFKADVNDGYSFVEWGFEGDYIVSQGDTKDEEIVLEAFSDIVATPVFKDAQAATAVTPTVNSGKTSPQTGNNTYAGIAFAAVLVAAAGVIVVKRKINQ